jgi:transposase
MNNITIYVGMDVHKESFTLCSFQIGDKDVSNIVKVSADCNDILRYFEKLRTIYGRDIKIVCGYEAGCLGFSLYNQLKACGTDCVILAPSTMMAQKGKRIKTDKRDAVVIARCLAYGTYSAVHIPTKEDDEVKEYIRMRDDHKLALKKVKQQILSFCLRHGKHYSGKSHWTIAHMKWLKALDLKGIYHEILAEYIATYEQLCDKIERFDARIAELASGERYAKSVKKLSCFMGIKTTTALATIVEVGDFNRFPTAPQFAAYLGLVPGENSSGDDQNRLGITKAGNSHMRRLLVEAAQCYGRGAIGHKSVALKQRQQGCSPEVIAYADRANERLRRRYYKMVLGKGKRSNVAKTAVARELACFIWGMMTEDIA